MNARIIWPLQQACYFALSFVIIDYLTLTWFTWKKRFKERILVAKELTEP